MLLEHKDPPSPTGVAVDARRVCGCVVRQAAAEISMGQEISENDLASIRSLATEVIELSAYRISLYE
jgi:RNA processing factor Prp31